MDLTFKFPKRSQWQINFLPDASNKYIPQLKANNKTEKLPFLLDSEELADIIIQLKSLDLRWHSLELAKLAILGAIKIVLIQRGTYVV